MSEVLHYYMPKILESDILAQLNLDPQKYFLVSAHREENIEPDKSFSKLTAMLNAVAEEYELPVIVSTHPRTQKRITSAGVSFHSRVKLLKL